MLKLIVFAALLIFNVFSLTACGGNQQSNNIAPQPTTVEKPKVPSVEVIKDGDTIKGDSAEVTINKVSFSYDVLPDKTDGFYTHYPAKKGNVYIVVDANIKNMQKQNLGCDKILTIEADYNKGYKYTAMPVVKEGNGGFTYANITSIKPLETRGMKFLIECPQETENSSNPLFLTFTLDGKKFQYNIR